MKTQNISLPSKSVKLKYNNEFIKIKKYNKSNIYFYNIEYGRQYFSR